MGALGCVLVWLLFLVILENLLLSLLCPVGIEGTTILGSRLMKNIDLAVLFLDALIVRTICTNLMNTTTANKIVTIRLLSR